MHIYTINEIFLPIDLTGTEEQSLGTDVWYWPPVGAVVIAGAVVGVAEVAVASTHELVVTAGTKAQKHN